MAHNHSHEPVDPHTPRGKQQRRALKAVSAIKGVMFVTEAITGYLAHSASMMADCAAMLEDTLSAAASVVVHKRGPRAQAYVALAKASVMGVIGLGILGGAVFTLLNPAALPVAATMGIIGGLGLAANIACGALLYRFRKDNINMMSSWKCLRNDIASNLGVLTAAGLSHVFTSAIPDLVIGAGVATLCVKSAIDIFREAIPLLRKSRKPGDKPQKQKASNTPQPTPRPGLTPRMSQAFKTALRSVFGKAAAKTPALELLSQEPAQQPLPKAAAQQVQAP